MQMDRSFCRNTGTSQSVRSLIFGHMEGDLTREIYPNVGVALISFWLLRKRLDPNEMKSPRLQQCVPCVPTGALEESDAARRRLPP